MSTYVPIQAITLSADTATVTFSNLPQTFTDLILVCNYGTSAIGRTGTMRFNSDSGTNYSWRSLGGNGTTASSSGGSNISSFYFTGQITGDGTALANVSTTHIQNYSNTTTYKTALSRSNDAARYVEAAVGTWRSTAAINQIDLARDNGTNWLSGSTFTLYGIYATTPSAVGGQVYVSGGYAYHVFRQSGIFQPVGNLTADILVVAGGGSGGIYASGGGGAGGAIAFSSQALTAQSYTVQIGAGGTTAISGTNNSQGITGNNSVFGSLTAAQGGGYGAGGANPQDGGNGGCGGGASGDDAPTTRNGGTGSQGFNGGGTTAYGAPYSGCGGGGMGGAGAGPAGSVAGAGGAGTNSVTNWGSLTTMLTACNLGVSGYIAGGGGGGNLGGTGGAAGSGGATAGVGAGQSANATANTGSGSGGSYTASSGNGGSGFVVVRYAV